MSELGPIDTRERIRLRAAAALYLVTGAGFGASVPIVLVHLRRHGELPMSALGWRYLAGPFEQLGNDRLAILGWVLVAISALDVLAGWWLRQGRRRGLRLALATDVPAFVLGVGFNLPLLIVGVPIRALLALSQRRNLR